MTATSRYGATRAELDALLAEWGEPRYRADQVWDALLRASDAARRRHRASPRAARRGSPRRCRSRSTRVVELDRAATA